MKRNMYVMAMALIAVLLASGCAGKKKPLFRQTPALNSSMAYRSRQSMSASSDPRTFLFISNIPASSMPGLNPRRTRPSAMWSGMSM
ncbi:hypothetical protein K7I13_08275 [Brucepastera parasyntrophica]|uniref:hypothetical protein n=1 Tax=Brucepastera parasyntrophica TaxID=2880008 RepID=UPI00210F0E76|nr:hypothetical protein [Brucepastera parasyntrophica]ULQ58567.1 hypothetical protein K7I13_08275 [Brucepastera parasyntrophica]